MKYKIILLLILVFSFGLLCACQDQADEQVADTAEPSLANPQEPSEQADTATEQTNPEQEGSQTAQEWQLYNEDLQLALNEAMANTADINAPYHVLQLLLMYKGLIPDSLIAQFLDYHQELCAQIYCSRQWQQIAEQESSLDAAAWQQLVTDFEAGCPNSPHDSSLSQEFAALSNEDLANNFFLIMDDGDINKPVSDLVAIEQILGAAINYGMSEYIALKIDYPSYNLILDQQVSNWDNLINTLTVYYDFIQIWPEHIMIDSLKAEFNYLYNIYIGYINLANSPTIDGELLSNDAAQSYADFLAGDSSSMLITDISELNTAWLNAENILTPQVHELIEGLANPFTI